MVKFPPLTESQKAPEGHGITWRCEQKAPDGQVMCSKSMLSAEKSSPLVDTRIDSVPSP